MNEAISVKIFLSSIHVALGGENAELLKQTNKEQTVPRPRFSMDFKQFIVMHISEPG